MSGNLCRTFCHSVTLFISYSCMLSLVALVNLEVQETLYRRVDTERTVPQFPEDEKMNQVCLNLLFNIYLRFIMMNYWNLS